MAQRKQILIRLPADLKDDLERWARDDLRSLNAQIEFLLREAVRRQRRGRKESHGKDGSAAEAP